MQNTAASPQRVINSQQNLALFRIYVAYRSLLSVVLLVMLISPNTRQLVGILQPQLYIVVAVAYLATSVLLMGSLSSRLHHNQRLLLLVFLVDIGAITVLAHSSGGMISGLPILLIITVAASAVLIANRTIATLVAALSVLATLGDTLWLISQGQLGINALFPSGLLGLLIFGVSLLVQAVAHRLGRAEELARNRGSDLYNLQRLNEQIVQHMDTGILLVSDDSIVRLMNKSATSLLAAERQTLSSGRHLASYSETLGAQFDQWQDTGMHKAEPFKVSQSGPDVIARFRELQPSSNRQSLIILEDYSPIAQFAQSLKLTSLGRLTASIAHEIRNPLGAISHAAQLMQESPALDAGDRRMADIIVEHSQRVDKIIESVMQISRREPPKPENILLSDWLQNYVGSYLDTLNREADVSIRCDYKEIVVEFDPENLQRVLSNLLDNALRHSKIATGRESAAIVVTLDFIANQCLLDVIDEGTGVPAEDREKLFEPFFTTVEKGSGMGLYLCQELCEINNASLVYRPTDSGASCFRIAMSQRIL